MRDKNTGNIYEGKVHGLAVQKYFDENFPGETVESKYTGNLIYGFTSNEGEFLTRTQAYNRAVKLKQLTPIPSKDTGKLGASEFSPAALEERGGTLEFKVARKGIQKP